LTSISPQYTASRLSKIENQLYKSVAKTAQKPTGSGI